MMEQFSVCSTSSSENDFVAESHIDSCYRFPNISVYPCVGRRPFVYNAFVPQGQRDQRNRIDKKNTNCFVKAFRWYTQELPTQQHESTADNSKIAGFATWLDKKYEQFLCDNKCQSTCLKMKQQYCMPDADNATERVEPSPRKTKLQRLKSPWKKNRQFATETERCPLRETCSFKYILRPEGARRITSQCCQKSSCCKCSDATLTNSETGIPPKLKERSHSAVCIRVEQPMNVTNYETCRSFNKDMTDDTAEHYKANKQKHDIQIMKTVSMKDVSCACGPKNMISPIMERKMASSDVTSNQISSVMSAEISEKYHRPLNYCEANVMTDPTSSNERTTFSAKTSCHSKMAASCQCSLQNIVKKESRYTVEKVGCLQNPSAPCCPCREHATEQSLVILNEMDTCNSAKGLHQMFNESEVQTSDHSIVFDRNPLYVKMICGNGNI